MVGWLDYGFRLRCLGLGYSGGRSAWASHTTSANEAGHALGETTCPRHLRLRLQTAFMVARRLLIFLSVWVW
jgi:hypothetical protein